MLFVWLVTSLSKILSALTARFIPCKCNKCISGKRWQNSSCPKMLPYVCITIAGLFAPKAVFVFLFLHFFVIVFFSFAVFFSRISTPTARFTFLALPLEEKFNIRLMRLWIIRQKETFFFTIWLLCLHFTFGKDVHQ